VVFIHAVVGFSFSALDGFSPALAAPRLEHHGAVMVGFVTAVNNTPEAPAASHWLTVLCCAVLCAAGPELPLGIYLLIHLITASGACSEGGMQFGCGCKAGQEVKLC
jgi:hypothetical protein